jgi:hypothetical protein
MPSTRTSIGCSVSLKRTASSSPTAISPAYASARPPHWALVSPPQSQGRWLERRQGLARPPPRPLSNGRRRPRRAPTTRSPPPALLHVSLTRSGGASGGHRGGWDRIRRGKWWWIKCKLSQAFVDTADHLHCSALTISFQAARSDLMRFTSSGLRFRCAIFRS